MLSPSGRSMTEAEIHPLPRLLMERTPLVAAGSMAVRAAIELMIQRGYLPQAGEVSPPTADELLLDGSLARGRVAEPPGVAHQPARMYCRGQCSAVGLIAKKRHRLPLRKVICTRRRSFYPASV